MTVWDLLKERIARRFLLDFQEADAVGFLYDGERVLASTAENGVELMTSVCPENAANMWGVNVDDRLRLILRNGFYFVRTTIATDQVDIVAIAQTLVREARRVRREAARPMIAPATSLFTYLSD
jgi:hypothetical protein